MTSAPAGPRGVATGAARASRGQPVDDGASCAPPQQGRVIQIAHLSTGSGGEAPPSPVATSRNPFEVEDDARRNPFGVKVLKATPCMYSAFLSLPPRSSRTSSMRIVACANPTLAPPRRNFLGEGFRKRRRSLLPLPLVAHRSSLIAHHSSLRLCLLAAVFQVPKLPARGHLVSPFGPSAFDVDACAGQCGDEAFDGFLVGRGPG